MKTILIIGATGTLGSAVTKRLLDESDYKIIQLSRRATENGINHVRISRIDADATSLAEIAPYIAMSDVVICTVSGETLPIVAEQIVAGMKKHGKKRLIFTGAVGIYNEIPEEMDGEDNLDYEPEQIPNRKGADIVEASGLDYTILRPGYLGDGDADDFVLSLKGEPAKGYKTTIPSLTAFICSLLEDNTHYHRESVSITKDMR